MSILIQFAAFVYLVLLTTLSQESEIIQGDFFVRSLMSKYGTNDTLSIDQLSTLLEALKTNGDQDLPDHAETKEPVAGGTATIGDHACETGTEGDDISSLPEACLRDKCLTAKEIVSYHSNASTINTSTLRKLSPVLLYQAQNKKCFLPRLAKKSQHTKPTKEEVWGYGILFVTVTNICALCGVLLVPFMNKLFYKKMLIFMVALAVGTLCGSSLFFLIPDAFGLAEYDEEGTYIWKALTVLGGIYLFFIIEYVMKAIMFHKEERKRERRNTYEEIATVASVQTHTHLEVDPELKVPPEMKDGVAKYNVIQNESSADLLDGNGKEEGEDNNACSALMNGNAEQRSESGSSGNNANHGHSHFATPRRQRSRAEKKKIAPVAWMIIFGDSVHNFIDGLSIGAAFTESIYLGISVSVAVICEELPHELGDFAILLNAGMSRWQAVGFNFLSACSCYLGLILGILVSEATSANQWVFAVSGGMFLYISLADMMPEVNHATEDEKNADQGKTKIFIIQNIGLLSGMGLMLILAQYGGYINFE